MHYTLRYHSRLPAPCGNRPLCARHHGPMLYRASLVHAYSRRLSAGGSKVIFTLRLPLPYTDRQLSLQKPKGYSSLSTPYIFNYRIMIPYFAHLSRRSAQTPLIFRPSPPKPVLFAQKKRLRRSGAFCRSRFKVPSGAFRCCTGLPRYRTSPPFRRGNSGWCSTPFRPPCGQG